MYSMEILVTISIICWASVVKANHLTVPRDQGQGGTHIDLPGQHDNRSPHPVVHREHPVHDPLRPPPGQPGHRSPHPVVHRKTTGQRETHVDLPGQHGHRSPHPVVQTTGQRETHVDLPGQHGHRSPHPVVQTTGQRETHVDLPGQHGNQSPHPVVHRERPGQHGNRPPPPVINSVILGHRETHAYLAGQHGNRSPHPVIHREGQHGHSPDNDPRFGSPHHLPGRHGNMLPDPLIHGKHTEIQQSVLRHVSLPDVHGNIPVHQPIGRRPTGHIAVIPHKTSIGQPEIHEPVPAAEVREPIPKPERFEPFAKPEVHLPVAKPEGHVPVAKPEVIDLPAHIPVPEQIEHAVHQRERGSIFLGGIGSRLNSLLLPRAHITRQHPIFPRAHITRQHPIFPHARQIQIFGPPRHHRLTRVHRRPHLQRSVAQKKHQGTSVLLGSLLGTLAGMLG